MLHIMGNIWDNIQKNKLRLILIVAGLVFVFIYHFIFPANPRSDDYLLLSTYWIKSSLWFSMIVSGLAFIIFLCDLFKRLITEGTVILGEHEKPKRQRKILGIIFGGVMFFFLLIFLLRLEAGWTPNKLILISLFLVFIVFIMDSLLEIDRVALNLDLPILMTLTLTTVLFHIYRFFRVSDDPFVIGFASGATAFQLILGNILFDPSYYSIERIFKLSPEEKERAK